MKKSLRSIALIAFIIIPSARSLSAQDSTPPARAQSIVGGVIRSAKGDSIPFALVRATTATGETVVHTNFVGRYSFVLAPGSAHISAAMVGYEAAERDITVGTVNQRVDFTLRQIAQMVDTVNVRAHWIGMRGIVVDNSTMQPIRGALITSIRRSKKIYTDSLGRFEFDLPRVEQTLLQISANGFQSKPTTVTMEKDFIPNLTLFLNPGEDPKYLHSALVDMEHRSGWGGKPGFTATRADMMGNGAKTLAEGILNVGARYGILKPGGCVFVDGEPMPSLNPYSINLANVDFVEYLGFNADATKTLSARWSADGCNARYKGRIMPGGPWISVWMRK